MRLQEKIKKDLAEAMKARDNARRDAIRVLMGEMARQENKELADDKRNCYAPTAYSSLHFSRRCTRNGHSR